MSGFSFGFGLWATFQSLWQQLVGPNLPQSWGILVKVSKSLIFLVTSFLGNFSRHWQLYTGHTDRHRKRNIMSRKTMLPLSKFASYLNSNICQRDRGNGCGSVGRAVARGSRFKSSHHKFNSYSCIGFVSN